MLRKTRGYLNFIILISIIVAFVGCGGGGGGTPPPDGNGLPCSAEEQVEAQVTVQVSDTVSQNSIDGADVHITTKDGLDDTWYKTNSEGKITFKIVRCFDASDETRYWPQYVTMIASKEPFYQESQVQDCPLGVLVCPSRVTDAWVDWLPFGSGYTFYLWLTPL